MLVSTIDFYSIYHLQASQSPLDLGFQPSQELKLLIHMIEKNTQKSKKENKDICKWG